MSWRSWQDHEKKMMSSRYGNDHDTAFSGEDAVKNQAEPQTSQPTSLLKKGVKPHPDEYMQTEKYVVLPEKWEIRFCSLGSWVPKHTQFASPTSSNYSHSFKTSERDQTVPWKSADCVQTPPLLIPRWVTLSLSFLIRWMGTRIVHRIVGGIIWNLFINNK